MRFRQHERPDRPRHYPAVAWLQPPHPRSESRRAVHLHEELEDAELRGLRGPRRERVRRQITIGSGGKPCRLTGGVLEAGAVQREPDDAARRRGGDVQGEREIDRLGNHRMTRSPRYPIWLEDSCGGALGVALGEIGDPGRGHRGWARRVMAATPALAAGLVL